MINNTLRFIVFAYFSLAFTSLLADEPLAVEMQAFKLVQTDDGTVTEIPAETALPGDTILYRATFRNQGDVSLTNLKPRIPVPETMVYLENSVKPTPTQVLVRGKGVQPFKPSEDTMNVELAAADYAAFIWQLDELDPGSSFQAEIQATVSGE